MSIHSAYQHLQTVAIHTQNGIYTQRQREIEIEKEKEQRQRHGERGRGKDCDRKIDTQ